MTPIKTPASALQRAMHIIRAELASYPGRPSLVTRIVLACTSVMVLVMVFRIPGAALGAYYPLLLSRDNFTATRKSATRIGVTCALGTAEIILGGVITAGSPFLHFFWVVGNLFAVFYLISALKFSDAALAVSVMAAVTIELWDQPISAELRVEHSLYTLLSILIACVVSVAIEALLAKKHPPDAVLQGVRQRLGLVEELLENCGTLGPRPSPLTIQLNRYAARGMGEMRELLSHANYDQAYQKQLSTVLALSGQLVELASTLAESAIALSAQDVRRCGTIARNVNAICTSLSNEEAPDWLDLPDVEEGTNPILVEMERTVDLIAQSFTDEELPVHHHLSSANPQKTKGIFVDDAFANHEHFKFAVRGTLSALVCYLFYMGTGWLTFGGSLATCFLTALPNTGASRHRQLLRFAGFIIGAFVLGLGAEVLILPRIDTLLQFAMLFAFVTSIGAWVATSGPRIAYCGFQIVLAYDLVNLNRFTINTTLIPARDAILGIALGIFAMWLIFDHLWAKSSTGVMHSLLLSTLRQMAHLDHPKDTSPTAVNQWLTAESTLLNRNFDQLRSLADLYAFESFPKTKEADFLNDFVSTLLPELRASLLVKTGILQHRLFAQTEENGGLVAEVQERSSELLQSVAYMIERSSIEPVSMWPTRDQELYALIGSRIREGQRSGQEHLVTEMRLCSSLLNLLLHVHAGAHAKLQWS